MLKKDNFFKSYSNSTTKHKINLKKTEKVFNSFVLDLKNSKIPLFKSYEKEYKFDFSKKTVKKFSQYKNIIIFGMGGSALGAKSIYSFFKKKIKKKVFFFDNLDSNLNYEYRQIKNLKNSCFILISKSGNTLETIVNFGVVFSKNLLENKLVVITESTNNTLISNNDTNTYKKNISKKLKQLTFNLKHNNINKKSACFWCTSAFDNEPIYVPKYQLNSTVHCYGCFCSPECACSYLMNENVDTSTKFERYYLLNNIYGKIYNYNKNIKPAPCPYYLLNKFYGNLDIQEYRKLLENERLLLIVDKPLSQILPEIYEENEDFLISAKIVSKSGTIKNNILKK